MFGNPLTPLNWFFEVLWAAAFVAEAWAFADALRRPSQAFPAASKQTKPLWLIILGVSAAIGLASAISFGGVYLALSILPVAAFIAAAIYLTDVRPAVRQYRRGSSSGPYGPW